MHLVHKREKKSSKAVGVSPRVFETPPKRALSQKAPQEGVSSVETFFFVFHNERLLLPTFGEVERF